MECNVECIFLIEPLKLHNHPVEVCFLHLTLAALLITSSLVVDTVALHCIGKKAGIALTCDC